MRATIETSWHCLLAVGLSGHCVSLERSSPSLGRWAPWVRVPGGGISRCRLSGSPVTLMTRSRHHGPHDYATLRPFGPARNLLRIAAPSHRDAFFRSLHLAVLAVPRLP